MLPRTKPVDSILAVAVRTGQAKAAHPPPQVKRSRVVRAKKATSAPLNAPRSTRTSSDPKEVRSGEWSAEWLACFAKTENSPQAFAKAVGVSYQTLWRVGIQGEPAGFKTRFQVRNWCTVNDVKSPL